MNKQEFLAELRKGLSGLPQGDIEERLSFYSEMIDDRMEEGLSESEAVAAIGSVSEVVAQILEEIPLTKLVKEKVKPSRTLKAWEIVLLALGSPIWLSLLIAAFVVILAVYIVMWSVIVSIWAIEISLAACALGGAVAAASGAAFLCYVTPAEHLALPSIDDVKQGIIASKIAAHTADIAKHIPYARDIDDKMADARKKFDWNKQWEYSIDPETAKKIRDDRKPEIEESCSMCGKFCAVRSMNKALDGEYIDIL